MGMKKKMKKKMKNIKNIIKIEKMKNMKKNKKNKKKTDNKKPKSNCSELNLKWNLKIDFKNFLHSNSSISPALNLFDSESTYYITKYPKYGMLIKTNEHDCILPVFIEECVIAQNISYIRHRFCR